MQQNSRELDIRIAVFLGWTWVQDGAAFYLRWQGRPGFAAMNAGGETYETSALLHYSTDVQLVRLVEDEIERRELVGPYVKALYAITGADDKWALIRATPEQRCLAALRAARQSAEAEGFQVEERE
jgi:hypothetical protein